MAVVASPKSILNKVRLLRSFYEDIQTQRNGIRQQNVILGLSKAPMRTWVRAFYILIVDIDTTTNESGPNYVDFW
jgi:hypothetical protein